jgi:hypothetical protein
MKTLKINLSQMQYSTKYYVRDYFILAFAHQMKSRHSNSPRNISYPIVCRPFVTFDNIAASVQ